MPLIRWVLGGEWQLQQAVEIEILDSRCDGLEAEDYPIMAVQKRAIPVFSGPRLV